MGLGRAFILIGAVLLILGVLLTFVPIRLGRLPGDIVYRGKNTAFYFPIVTSLLLSVVFSLLLWLFSRRGN